VFEVRGAFHLRIAALKARGPLREKGIGQSGRCMAQSGGRIAQRAKNETLGNFKIPNGNRKL